ncbi:MAG: putative CAMK family protein kinase [Streblomastix strix]|uniref:non-specific serine/threonine protein kinase n=1 Tax=Streblomastix strix TaxID=222440 RepID=A0A5J4VAB6_9EUKA|nr:MAG: putative CAMK family protein kinase [Streblomastix strix]
MTQSGELFEVVTDYPGKPGDAQFLPVSKGEIVRVIKQESEWFTIEKKGKVPRSNLRPYTSTTSVSQIHSISTSQKYLKSQNSTSQPLNVTKSKKEDKISSARSSIVQYPVDIKASSSTSSSLYHAPKFEEFDIRRKLEGGVMGRTYLVRLKESNNFFVMKRVDYLTKDDKDAAEEEVAQLRRLSSQYTVKLLWAFTRDSDLCLIQEFCSGGDLRNTIKELQKIPEIERVDLVWELFTQIVLALNHLHTHNVMHRDIKPANIFIMEDGTARLGDFGLAKNLKEDSNATVAGTRFYRPPESFMWQKMSYSADIFALGVVICELLIGKHPFLAETESETIENIKNAKLSSLPDWIPIEMKSIVMNMMIVV